MLIPMTHLFASALGRLFSLLCNMMQDIVGDTIIQFLVLALVLVLSRMLTHTGERSFKCEVCATSLGYNGHLGTHTGEG